jgi:hypothetical protein
MQFAAGMTKYNRHPGLDVQEMGDVDGDGTVVKHSKSHPQNLNGFSRILVKSLTTRDERHQLHYRRWLT